MAELYKPYTNADAVMSEAGFKPNAFLALTTWLAEEAKPTLTAAMGDNYRIVTDHTFGTGKGMLPVYCFPNTNEGGGDMQGDQGAKKLRFTVKLFIQGDNPASLELVQNIKNKSLIIWAEKPGCGNEVFVQYGCKCTPATVESTSNVTGTYNAGKAGYEVTFEAYEKYFYEGATTVYP